jgi:hypothetical protein
VTNTPSQQLIEDEFEQARGIAPFSPEPEREFLFRWRIRAARWLRWIALIGAGLFIAIAPLDLRMYPREEAMSFWMFRFAIAVPCLLLVFASTLRPKWVRLVEPMAALGFLVSASGLLTMGVTLSTPGSYLPAMNGGSILLAMHALPVVRFRMATVTGWVVFAWFEGWAFYRALPVVYHLGFAANLVVLQLLGMVVSYSLEAGARAQFRDERMIAQHKDRLQALLENMLQRMEQPPPTSGT